MHLHILGICGTFMGGIALLARALGHRVTGSDANVYPPMSTQLTTAGIDLMSGYAAEHLQPAPDLVVVGNALKRGMPAIEYLLDADLPYVSGPQWLAEHVLRGRHVLAVAGTHGKTTTASLLAWLLECAGLNPGFLIGGVPRDFDCSARLGAAPYFVVEADEYDTAFFDKRSKFVHYRPRTLILNNLEFDHADIFDDLAAIQRQFHHLVRIAPRAGRIVHPRADPALAQVLAQGCWTPTETLALDDPAADWSAQPICTDGTRFVVARRGAALGEVVWSHTGKHNVLNALAAVAAAAHIGVEPRAAVAAVARFGGVRRRMELRGEVAGVRVYDDFAHHPTAIATTLDGLRHAVGAARILALLEPRSNTMRLGVHAATLAAALTAADLVYVLAPSELDWDAAAALAPLGGRLRVAPTAEQLLADVLRDVRAGDHLVAMSNGAFYDIHARLLAALAAQRDG